MSQHIGPRTISAIGGSVKRVGNYRVHTFPSELVTDGLVLNLDAGDPRSYPSSGTTWTDLSGNGHYGTITSCGYDNANGGFLDFVPANNSRVAVDNFSSINSSYTVEIWFKSDEVVNYRNICDMNYEVHQPNTGPRLEQTSTGTLRWYTSASTTGNSHNVINLSSTLVAGTIYHAVITYDSTNRSYSGYLNGAQVVANQAQQYGGDIPFDGIKLGVGFTGSRYFDGKIYGFRIYNRALSAAEVAQNYDALRVRYGSYTNTFTPLCGGGEGKVEVLCVAGGGGGGTSSNPGGGGGAGGLIYNSAFSVDSNSGVSLSIGQGGTGSINLSSNNGVNGSNSTFSTLTAIGGGRGSTGSNNGSNGGSGGGGNFWDYSLGGLGIAGQGNNGGNGDGYVNNTYATGGGGGSGSKGQDGLYNTYSGNGGSGLSYSISGESKFYAAGGGGAKYVTGDAGVGGSGIGGDGGSYTIRGTNGIPNTGSGGGGGSNAGAGNGSNGIVIVRYPATDYNVEVLVVGAGGGGGGSVISNGGGGGGGAGGLVYYSSYPVSSGTKYSINVGAGGLAVSAVGGVNGSNGNNSVFGSLTAFGGGGGSYGNGSGTGSNGGSGGGGGYRGYTTVSNGGFGISGQGNNGGGVSSVSASGAGGGGAGGVGQSNAGTGGGSGGQGGIGLIYSITGSSVTYAKGGQGGFAAETTGAANTGNGGCGSYADANSNKGYNGGSGIVIITYKGPQRGIGGTIDTTSRPGYTLHKFTTSGTDFFIP